MVKKRGPVKSILFVCTGNSCRSVMAEGFLKKMLKEAGREGIKISSAGIAAVPGFTPTDNTIEVMRRDGIDVTGYKTSKVTADMLKEADLILAMENIHKFHLLRLYPRAEGKTYLLKEFVNKRDYLLGFSVPDPIGQPMEAYERIYGMIKTAVKELLKKL